MIVFGYWFALVSLALARYRHRNRIVVFDRYRYQFLYDCYGPFSPWLIRRLPAPDQIVWLSADLDTLTGRMGGRDRERPRMYYRLAHQFHAQLADRQDWTTVRTDRPADRIEAELFETITRPETHPRSSGTDRKGNDPRTVG